MEEDRDIGPPPPGGGRAAMGRGTGPGGTGPYGF